MITYRKEALQRAQNRDLPFHPELNVKVSELFGCNVFGRDAMREYLPAEVFESIMRNINEGTGIDRRIADHVA
ncbi:MAG: glutamine synthetase III, partial [Bacteroidales bacterium]